MHAQVLLVSDGLFHPTLRARFWLRRTLEAVPGIALQPVHSLERLAHLDLQGYRAAVLYYHHRRLSAQALHCLERFVRQGGGILAVHSATASFKQEPAYFDILGGRFTGHGAVTHFEVRPAGPPDEIFGQVAPFEIQDELYRHETDPAVRVHYYAMVNGQPEPFVWTHAYGQGRVCYLAAGHHSASLRHPAIQSILQCGLQWVVRIHEEPESTKRH